jgi:hypothetical protein
MIRLKSLLSFGNSLDPTCKASQPNFESMSQPIIGDYVNVVIWTIVELAVAMVCSCFPAIRNLLMRIYPRAFLSSIGNMEDKPPGTVPWDSHKGQRRATLMSNGGFVELQERHETGTPETPPEVPPKESSTSIHSTTALR